MNDEIPTGPNKPSHFFADASIAILLLAVSLASAFYLSYLKGTIPTHFPSLVGMLLGGALLPFLFSLLFSRLIKGSGGAVLGLIVIAGFTAIIADQDAKGRREREARMQTPLQSQNAGAGQLQSPPAAPRSSASSPAAFPWQSPNREYSVVFPFQPEVSQDPISSSPGAPILTFAICNSWPVFQRIEFVEIPRSKPITKAVADAEIEKYARDFDMEHQPLAFVDDDPDDIIAAFRGTKRIAAKSGEVVIEMLGERHWGRRSVFTVLVGWPPKSSITQDSLDFLSTIRHQP